MTFQKMPISPKNIAVIGGGISGLGAAHALSDTYNVTLFETENRLGGHARTILAGKNGDQPVDTGFIVFNYANYPELSKLFSDLNVPVVKSDMSFGASVCGGKIEYALRNFDAIFAQRKNVFNPKFIKMVWDINRFNTLGLTVADDKSITIRQFLERLKTGDWFRDCLLYVSRLENVLLKKQVDIRLSTPVASVSRHETGVAIKTYRDEVQMFDEVVFATHSDDTLALLTDASPTERQNLGCIKYQDNEVVLHSDVSLMPKLHKCWASWVYTERKDKSSEKIDLTYWMNSLQPIPLDDPMFVTLNSTRNIEHSQIFDQVTMRHPVYDLDVLEAQKEIAKTNGQNRTWFSGAWVKNGFHEDGLTSGLDVARKIISEEILPIAAE